MTEHAAPKTPLYLLVHSDHPLDPLGPNSGAEMATLNQARALAKAGYPVCVAAILKQEISCDRGVTFIDLGAAYEVERALDWADSQGEYNLIVAGKAIALFLARRRPRCRKKLLITHDRSVGNSGVRPELLEYICDHILCVSHAQRDKLAREGVPLSHMSVIHNGVDFDIFKPCPPSHHNPRRLVFSGALVLDKGIHLLIGAFLNLKVKYPDLSLDVFGSSSLWSRDEYLNIEELKATVSGLYFHGNAPQRDIAEALGRSGICVVPSMWFDPYPLTSLEAQACGTPVVAFRIGGLPEGIAHNSTGFVVDDVSAEGLTKALDSLLSDPQRLACMSDAALSWSAQRFQWSDVVNKIVRLCGNTPSSQGSDSVYRSMGAQPSPMAPDSRNG